jgi:GntR family transcriptional repressor for pyruvate dehydrogenase complex
MFECMAPDTDRPGPARDADVSGLRFGAVDRPRQVSAHIADQIQARIDDGTLAVGQRLPTEAELSRDFGVSRPSVREALAALQFVGLVESRRGFGTVVVARSNEAGVPAVPERSRGARPALTSVGQALDLLEARLVVEPAVMAVAATDPDRRALALAGELIDGMDLALDDPAMHVSTDIRVHRALLSVCRNEILRESARELLDLALDPMLMPARSHAWASHDRPQDWAGQHRLVHEAIASGDAAAARAACQAHLVSVVDGLSEVVDDDEAKDEATDDVSLTQRFAHIRELFDEPGDDDSGRPGPVTSLGERRRSSDDSDR